MSSFRTKKTSKLAEFIYKNPCNSITNFIDNAIKFTEAGRVVLLVSLQKLSAVHYQLSITVSDSGPGIPKEEQERIFGEFTRLADTEEVEGFGLGLSITRSFCP